MPQILVVEDDNILRHKLVHLLTHNHYYVSEAVNGREAIRGLRTRPVDLVITDIIMPEMDGVETITTVKREFPHIKIIAISGGGLGSADNYLKMASEVGADKTIAKPFSFEVLLAAVSELLHPQSKDRTDGTGS